MKPLKIHAEVKTKADVCERHGAFESRCYIGDAWTGCPTCFAEEEAKLQAQADEKARRARLDAWQKKIGHKLCIRPVKSILQSCSRIIPKPGCGRIAWLSLRTWPGPTSGLIWCCAVLAH